MSTSKKTRGDSILGTLPPDRQTEIAEHANAHTLAETRDWLKADGIKVSSGALSGWLSSFVLRQRFRLADADTLQFIQLLRTRRPDLPEAELQQWGAEYFQMQAVKAGDAETFLAFSSARTKAEMEKKKLNLKERQFTLDRERFEFDAATAAKKFAAEIKTISANPKLNESQKINAIRQRLFGVLPEQSPATEAKGAKG